MSEGQGPKRLYRSSSDRMLSGVCGGLAAYFGVDPTLVRIAAVVLLFVSGGTAGLAYIVAMFIVPKEPS